MCCLGGGRAAATALAVLRLRMCLLLIWRQPTYPSGGQPTPPEASLQGVGEFQCYDRRALASLAAAAREAGHPEWGNTGG